MSRTYRRKDRPVPIWIDHKWIWMDGNWLSRRRLEGNELRKVVAKYHSDHDCYNNPNLWWRRQEWKKFRAQAKQEIIRGMKSSDYEVQIRANPRWPWWD